MSENNTKKTHFLAWHLKDIQFTITYHQNSLQILNQEAENLEDLGLKNDDRLSKIEADRTTPKLNRIFKKSFLAHSFDNIVEDNIVVKPNETLST